MTNPPSYPLRHIYDNIAFDTLNLRVCLSGPPEDRRGFALWLGRAGCSIVDDPLESDFVIFTGGSDVNPDLYNESAIPETYVDLKRDQDDLVLWSLCRLEGIPMVGICRGAQFLWVKMGGELYQDIDNHNDGFHDIFVFEDNKKYRASSVHHQSCRPKALPGLKMIANCAISNTRKSATHTHTGIMSDFEIYAFEKEGILGIQGHPEYSGFPNYSALCIRLIDKYLYDNVNTVYVGGRLRLKKEKI